VVSQGLLVEVTNARRGVAFRRLVPCPLYLGRDPNVCNCVLDEDLAISRLHASVDVREGRIKARDVQSAIGTYWRGIRLESDVWNDLGPLGERQELRLGEWSIGLTAQHVEGAHVLQGGPRPRASIDQTASPAHAAPLAPLGPSPAFEPPPPLAFSPYAPPVAAVPRSASAPLPAPVPQGAPPTADLMADAEEVHRSQHAHRTKMDRFRAALAAEMGVRSPKKRAQLAEALWIRFPELADDPEIGALLQRGNGRTSTVAGEAAVAAVQDLSRAFGNDVPPQTGPEIEAFAFVVKSGVAEILAGLMPLLAGVARFEQEMAVRTRQATGVLQFPQTPEGLGSLLFDWQASPDAAIRTLRSSFADLMTNQIGTLNGIMRGVRALLDELSPFAIATAWQLRHDNEGPLRKLLGLVTRPAALWRLFVERHADLADEEQERFRIVFGPQFAEEYRGYKRALRQQQASPVPPSLIGPSGTKVLVSAGDRALSPAARQGGTERMP
jgi:predicted component of type VI protein secretion system